MKRIQFYILWSLLIILTLGIFAFTKSQNTINDNILSFTLNPKIQDIQFYWKNEQGEKLRSIQNVINYVSRKNRTLIFAMNGGMYTKDGTPQGLFIQNYKTLTTIDTSNGSGNFYMKPNGIFYLTSENIPIICKTTDFKNNEKIKYATQSGPMLLIDGQIHSAFKIGSSNLNIRNGVGILPNNEIVFAMSKSEINFYDFAKYFQDLGCKNALYLDGFVSRTYLPQKNWEQTDGNFGVIIGVTDKK